MIFCFESGAFFQVLFHNLVTLFVELLQRFDAFHDVGRKRRHGILFLIVGIIIVTLGIGKIQRGRGGVDPDATLDGFDGGLDDLR